MVWRRLLRVQEALFTWITAKAQARLDGTRTANSPPPSRVLLSILAAFPGLRSLNRRKCYLRLQMLLQPHSCYTRVSGLRDFNDTTPLYCEEKGLEIFTVFSAHLPCEKRKRFPSGTRIMNSLGCEPTMFLP